MSTGLTTIPQPVLHVRLRTDQARLTTGRLAAIQIALDGGARAFVVATAEEAAQGWIVRDARPVFTGLHDAFDAAHREAIRQRRSMLAQAA